MEGFGGIKNGGHFLSLLSVHQEQVELGWPGLQGVTALRVLDDSGGGGPEAEQLPLLLDQGKVLGPQRETPHIRWRPQLSKPHLLGGQHVLWVSAGAELALLCRWLWETPFLPRLWSQFAVGLAFPM